MTRRFFFGAGVVAATTPAAAMTAKDVDEASELLRQLRNVRSMKELVKPGKEAKSIVIRASAYPVNGDFASRDGEFGMVMVRPEIGIKLLEQVERDLIARLDNLGVVPGQ